ncbi:hypothetical protein [Pseudomonas sp. FEN]|nr:hypothetical protein [Pseudomonas sp. FEN]
MEASIATGLSSKRTVGWVPPERKNASRIAAARWKVCNTPGEMPSFCAAPGCQRQGVVEVST